MVAKISVGNSLRATILYNARKVEDGEARVLHTNRLFDSADGRHNPLHTIRELEDHLPSHFRTEKPTIHISLNPHPDDRLTDEQLAAIAEEYMERMGYGEQPYIVYKHEDISRHHLHIVSLRVDGRGRKIDDKFEHRKSRRIVKDLERKYGLIATGDGQVQSPYKPQKVDVERGEVERQVGALVGYVAANYHLLSFNEYRAILSLYNVSAQEVRGEERGRPYRGVVYSATDDEGNKIGNHFNSSEFVRSVGYEALQRGFARSKIKIKEGRLAQQTRLQISETLRQSRDRDEFQQRLRGQNIDVIFRDNDAGRLYGATFVDHNNHCVFNGSRLGRDLSANALSEWFENPQITEPTPTHTLNQEQSNDSDFSLGGLFDFPIDDGFDDNEDERAANAIKRRLKKKKGRKM
ncbi:MAG: conjugal transfer protein MobB [Rikenellaceae bacterium]